jgi:hypothetical protein
MVRFRGYRGGAIVPVWGNVKFLEMLVDMLGIFGLKASVSSSRGFSVIHNHRSKFA